MKSECKKDILFVGIFLFGIFALQFILATTPVWQGSTVNYSVSEDVRYYHNLSNNITGYSSEITFSFDTETNVTWTNSSGTFSISKDFISGWISILNSSTGNLSIDATHDNETGFFLLPIQATNTTDNEASVTIFEFLVNATNDAPNFTEVLGPYNLTQDQSFFEYINSTDEEGHYPVIVNITFFANCTHADWTGRSVGQNCSLLDLGLNLTNIANLSASMNFTPVRNDVGTYWANVTTMDYGANYSCPHAYCLNSTYRVNQSTTQIVKFNVFSTLDINVTDCQNASLNEAEEYTCTINITTRGSDDSLSISTTSDLRNYGGYISNGSWYQVNTTQNASGFVYTLPINVTPQKTEVGNWTISLLVVDNTHDENSTALINVHVQKNASLEDTPLLDTVSNVNTSTTLLTTVDLTVYDEDLKIPDKNHSYGGYNETINFTVQIFNLSDMSSTTLQGFDVDILYMPVVQSGVLTNRTTARISFTPNSSEGGNYYINLSVRDRANNLDFQQFNVSILTNNPPNWNLTTNNFTLIEDVESWINLSLNVSDPDGNALSFSFTNDTLFPSLEINETTGIINITPMDVDVGEHLVTVVINDGFLTNSTVFNFTVSNVNDNVSIETPLIATNASVGANSNMNVTEDNYTKILLWIADDDIKIPAGQTGFYNENFTVNVTIEGPNTDLFNFSITGSFPTGLFPNRTEYEAIFTPNKTDVGTYNITLNVTDYSNVSDVLQFNITISEIAHDPVLMNLTNQTSYVNASFFYDINATDTEDGNESMGNLTFFYNFISGSDFIDNNESIFNTTSGELNITFNDTQVGTFVLNITVNDSAGSEDFGSFYIYVYDNPSVTYPNLGTAFTPVENVTSNLVFQVNHTIGNNLTCLFYLDNVLKYNVSSYGNATNFTWAYTPNFTEETFGADLKNLTLIVSNPSEPNLMSGREWTMNITHTNYPLAFSSTISNQSGGSPISLTLSDYFTDIDASDALVAQIVNFTYAVVSPTGQTLSPTITQWINAGTPTISFAATASGAATYRLNATEYNMSNLSQALSSVLSNNFSVTINVTTPPPEVVYSSTNRDVPISLKIIVPDPLSAFKKDRIELPIRLSNDGKSTLYGIELAGAIAKDNITRDDVSISFSQSYFSSLGIGEKQNLTMIVDINTNQAGLFELTISADVERPVYNDWAKIYLTVKEGTKVEEIIVFTEEFIAENPECIELTELVNEAKDLAEQGLNEEARLKTEEALDACKSAISQARKGVLREAVEDHLYRYLVITTLVVFFGGIAFYSYKRIILKRKRSIFRQEKTLKIKQTFNNLGGHK